MADFVRPEVRQLFMRWWEVMTACALAIFGLWWALTGVAMTFWLGVILVPTGLIWALAAVQRVRFAQDGAGPGVVTLKERRISYFGPLDGGIIDVEDITQLALDPTSWPEPSWVITGVAPDGLVIPVNAAGADVLFDAFVALPGMDTKRMLAVLSDRPDAITVIWHKERALIH